MHPIKFRAWDKGNLNSFDFMIMENRRNRNKRKRGYEVLGNIYENKELLK